jgi:hypothetical protein
MHATSSHEMVETLDHESDGRRPKSMSVHRDSQDEHFRQATLCSVCQSNRIPYRCSRVTSAVSLTLETTIGKSICPEMPTTITSSHGQTSVNPVRLGVIISLRGEG